MPSSPLLRLLTPKRLLPPLRAKRSSACEWPWARPRFPPTGCLWCADPLITALTALAAGDAAPALAREALEQCFQRLCQARPGGSAGLPEGPEFAALVLVLRELLHHYGYAGVGLVEGDGEAEA